MNMGNLRRIERKDDGGANVAAEVKKEQQAKKKQ